MLTRTPFVRNIASARVRVLMLAALLLGATAFASGLVVPRTSRVGPIVLREKKNKDSGPIDFFVASAFAARDLVGFVAEETVLKNSNFTSSERPTKKQQTPATTYRQKVKARCAPGSNVPEEVLWATMSKVLEDLEEEGISAASLAPLKTEVTPWIEAQEAARAEAAAREKFFVEQEARKKEAQARAEEAKAARRRADETSLAMCLRRATTTRSVGDLMVLERAIEVAQAAGVDADKVRVARDVLARKGRKGGRQSDWNSQSAGVERWYETDIKFR